MHFWEVVQQVGIALAGGAGGVVLAAWKFWSGLQKRLQALEVDNLAKDKATKALSDRTEKLEQEHQHHRDEVDRRFDTNRAEHNRFVGITAFNSFTGEQNEQWQAMNRTLGRIEGEIATRRERGSWTNET
jgi:hypothetical protein